jgi:soluble lytic murein transglycosylase-like protein
MLAGALLALGSLQVYIRMTNHAKPLQPQSSSITIPWLPVTVQRWKVPIQEMARKYNIDPDLLAIIMIMESGGYAEARSEANAQGLMQVTPPTARDIAAKFLKQPGAAYDLYDPRTNIEFGAAYLSHLRDTFGATDHGPSWNTTVELVAAGYNGGPGAAGSLEKGQGLRGMQTLAYSRDVCNMWRERHADVSPTFERWAERGGSTLINKAETEQGL